MGWSEWSQRDVKAALSNVMSGKQPSPDHIKGEILKWMKEDSLCLGEFTHCQNHVVTNITVLESWKMSWTAIFPKTKKYNKKS